jgi:calcineurin-like phosphoesterase family protein
MNKYYFYADPHYDHANIIKYCKRPFAGIVEMNETLIANHNNVVTNNDYVYCIGDFLFGHAFRAVDILKQLNFKEFNFIWGNHDKAMHDLAKRQDLLAQIGRKVNFLGHFKEIRVNKQEITLCHYGMRVWNKSHHGAWCLYGHSHGTLPDDPNALAIDVGVDCHNYTPLSFEQIKEIMAKKKFKPIDHHQGTNEAANETVAPQEA